MTNIDAYDEQGEFLVDGTVSEWLAANDEDREICEALAALQVEDEVWLGGGSAPLTRYVRTR